MIKFLFTNQTDYFHRDSLKSNKLWAKIHTKLNKYLTSSEILKRFLLPKKCLFKESVSNGYSNKTDARKE